MQHYFSQFDEKYKNLEYIDRDFYKNEIGVVSFVSRASTRDAK
jgi:hypothetical protein